MADTKSIFDWILADHVSGPAKKMEGALNTAAKTAGGGTSAFGKMGSAIGSLINPTTLAIGAVGALTAGVGDALKKAADHQVVSERLNAVLKANVQGYNGNRDAIDSYIAKQTDLGFTVDETTASYAQLLAATHDTRKATEFLAAAQDLARLKGISLADATDAMTKIEAGRFRGLANLGIVLQKGATVTEALTAVQKVAAGQAATYADTVAGKMATLNAKWDELQTKAGETIADLANKFAGFVVDVALPNVSRLQQAIADTISGFINQFGNGPTINRGRSGGYGPASENRSGVLSKNSGGTLTRTLGTPDLTPHGSPVTIKLILDGKQVAQVVDQHLYYMLKGSPATRMRN